jgi:Mrp family chromosome partitioning ATPase
VLLLSATAVALWPRTYGTEATLALDAGPPLANAAALAGRLEAALLEREVLAHVAIELPPELRSPDPIGRLRAGIRVQPRAQGYSVEFRGSEPQSVQRIANLLAERAVLLVPRLTASPEDKAPALALAARTRAVTEFLTAHPEMTLEPTTGKANGLDSGLEALRTEKRQLEQRLASGNTDNPYVDPGQDPDLLNRRLTELKNTIARREKALKEPHPATPTVAPELVTQWRQLLADLAAAQSAANVAPPPMPARTAHLTARAPLPSSPLTPNRLVLSIVALLLSAAAALVAYVLPRKPEPRRYSARPSPATPGRSEPPPGPRSVTEPLGMTAPLSRSDAPPRPVDPPIKRSDPPPPDRPGSEPPGPIAVQRTVVLSGSSGAPQQAIVPARSHTAPGGLEAPSSQAIALASTALVAPSAGHAPGAPLFGSRPPPGAGSYSVSSSHPPPMDTRGAPGSRTSVERLSPLQTSRPLSPSAPPRGNSPVGGNIPQIVSRPPALDPDAENWAARFETVPPPAAPAPGEPTRPTHPIPEPEGSETEGSPRKRAGRWKTQVMGSMVPLEISDQERPPESDAIESFRGRQIEVARQAPSPAASISIHHDVPLGWRPNLGPVGPEITNLRDAVLEQAAGRRVTLLTTGAAGPARSVVACALALALGESGARVLLIEADFDKPELHRALALATPPGAGLSQQLMERRHAKSHEPWVLMRCSANLQVLAEGRFRSPGLIGSKEFEQALIELREQHHIVIVHAPALSRPDDLRALANLGQAVLLVEPGKPSQLRFSDTPLRGLV